MSATTSDLNERLRQVLGPMANCLIPEAEGMPSAEQAGVAREWIDVALAARPDLADAFLTAVRTGTEHSTPEAAIAYLHDHDVAAFDAFSTLVAGAYLMVPQVKQLIGYPGQESRPVIGDDVPIYIDMLESVAERGPRFRPTP